MFLWVEHAAIGDQSNSLDTAVQLEPDVLLFALVGITLIGLSVGVIEVLFLNRLFNKKSFFVKILSKFIIYNIFFSLVILVTFPIAASLELDVSIWNQQVWDKYVNFFFSITNLSAMSQIMFSLLMSLLYAEIHDHLGQNVLLNFFTGKYHKPLAETRIFMFADMKASTTIAENLGHIRYFELLRSYYYDLSNAIVNNHGEVYQYIGDEIVISWTLKNGIAKNYCLNCFFDMKADLAKRKETYLKTYGVFPDFKAALHFGEVTTGEIGALKKEIFFTGDVLNTTARMQSLCGTYGVDLLVSKKLINELDVNNAYTIKTIGEPQLRGKNDTIDLVTITLS